MNIEFLNLLKSQEGDLGRKKKNREDEPIQIKIHIYMQMSQENSLCCCLKKTKMSFLFSFTKLENRRVEQVLSGKSGISGRRRLWVKGAGG
jgi:hypothetical protein